MSEIENPRAFPHEAFNEWVGGNQGDGGTDYQHTPQSAGMTLRDYFAGQALVGLMADSPWADPVHKAAYAYNAADAMLAARKGEGS